MGKKQVKEKKKFDRNVEISAPILDPQAIKAIHTNPFSSPKRLDIKSFKALLGGHNSQDSIDELTPLNDNHVPSYIGISCAVSGYSNYSSYNRRAGSPTSIVKTSTTPIVSAFNPNRSRTTSPVAHQQHQVNHITIDKNHIQSADEERKELTEKLTASATEPRRSPSPCIPPTEDDRHHGAYVGARYCPLPPPSKIVNKHIPLLGIDDDQDPDEVIEQDENKVEQRIASLYGDNFVEDWRESMTHKTKKEIAAEANPSTLKSPKDLVSLKPAPLATVQDHSNQSEIDIPAPNVKVLANVEKQFLNKLLSDDNPPMPGQVATYPEHVAVQRTETKPINDTKPLESNQTSSPPPASPVQIGDTRSAPVEQQSQSPLQQVSPPMSPDSGKSQSLIEEDVNLIPPSQVGEEHIEYEIRAQSPIDNNASPVKVPHHHQMDEQTVADVEPEHNLVNFSPEPTELVAAPEAKQQQQSGQMIEPSVVQAEENAEVTNNNEEQDGRYYLGLLEKERNFLLEQVEHAKEVLIEDETKIDQDMKGMILSANGKAFLLVNKKFKQFEELCEANINKKADAQFATLNDDLAGFWDLLNIQVSEIRKSFETLWEARANNWRLSDSHKPFVITEVEQKGEEVEDSNRTTNRDKSSKSKLSAQKDQERRERLQEHINQIKQNQAAKVGSQNLLNDSEEEDNETSIELASKSTDEQPTGFDGEKEISPIETEQEAQMFSLIGVGVESLGIDSSSTDEPNENLHENVKTNLVDLSEP